jgi:hypothetical protein
MIGMNRRPLRKRVARERFVRGFTEVATASRSSRQFAAAVLALLLTSVTAPARETRLGAIGFELPKDWKVETDGTERLTASPSGSADTPPLFMAEFCLANSGHSCPAVEAPNAEKTGCVEPQLTTKQWRHGVAEKRWICPRVASATGVYSLAVGHFLAPTWALRVVYVCADKDKPPNKFLDDLAKSLRKD